MKKRFSSLVSSFNGASCKSKKEMDVDVDYQAAQPTRARRRTAVATVVVESGCRCVRQGRRTRRSVPAIDMGEDDMSRARETPAYLWRKEEKWEEVLACSEEELGRRKINEEEEDEDEDEDQDKVPLTIDFTKARRTRDMNQRRSLARSRSRISTSSCDSSCCSSEYDDDEDEENYETEEDGAEEDDNENNLDDNTLLSALSLTTCSTANSQRNRSSTRPDEPRVASASAVGRLKKLVPCAADEGRVQESFAVVKKSEDPRGDFRRSMAEMVVEKGIYDAADLEQLLHCFLSLNSRRHHRAIVSAFSDIWQTLFPDNSPNFSYKQ